MISTLKVHRNPKHLCGNINDFLACTRSVKIVQLNYVCQLRTKSARSAVLETKAARPSHYSYN